MSESDAQAEARYRRARDLRPDLPETHYNLALWLQTHGRGEEAIAGYRAALLRNPAFGRARNNLGNLLRAAGRLDEANEQYALAVEHEPSLPEPHQNLGAALRAAGRIDEAIPLLERALELKPDLPMALNNLGLARFARYRHDEALDCYRRALELRPAYDDALANMGTVLDALGRPDEAVEAHRAFAARQPGNVLAHAHLARSYQSRGDLDAALASYEQALKIAPGHAEALCGMGSLLAERGLGVEAMGFHRRALEADPRNARAAHALAVEHLKRFEFAPGWDLAESRFDTTPPITLRRALAQPFFTAADWGKGRVAVWREQGVGDQLLFATLLPELEARGQDFVAEIDARLIPAFARAHPGWSMAAPEAAVEAFAGCDRQLPMGSLPRLLRRDAASFAAQPRALLAADARRSAGFSKQLGAGGPWIGISWRSFQARGRGKLERNKSAPLAAFSALARNAGVQLLDLQYGDTAAEREAFAREGGVLRHLEGLDLFHDLDGVLAAMQACEAVVTTSNVTAHLAGSIGKRTLLVYPAGVVPFHYWIAGPDGRSLWYPSVEIVSGAGLDTWEKVLARAAAMLAA